MKLIHWEHGDPPKGFEFGPVPTDFGVGRAAYSFDESGNIKLVIYRGDTVIVHDNGSMMRLGMFRTYGSNEVLGLIREAARSGLTEETV